ncbi:hypothetical protein ACQP1O_10085 [Nocardia sp. CA-151230]|uniref:hypothetical protein n=1 Tax=Nocardia sp. CA-151230 TaxID=3239982 RepID=UPI003D906929
MARPQPDRATVLAELTELRAHAQTTGTRISVLALARRVGLANTTFRRRFPDITAELTAEQQATQPPPPAAATDDTTKLRQRNRDLRENLDLAVAQIQRLTLENKRLRQELETASSVTHLRPPKTPTLSRSTVRN